MNLYLILLKVQPGREAEARLVFIILFAIILCLIASIKSSINSSIERPIRAGCFAYFGIPALLFLILLTASLLIAATTE